MKLIFHVTIAVIFLGAFVFGQKPTPSDNDVVRISTNLIQLDVSITDSKGRPIKDIRSDEIEIFENGERQNIANFSFVNGPVRTAAVPAVDKKKGEILLPTSQLRPENVRRTIAIVVDDLNLSFSSSAWVKKALKKYVDEQIQQGDLVAIIRTGGIRLGDDLVPGDYVLQVDVIDAAKKDDQRTSTQFVQFEIVD